MQTLALEVRDLSKSYSGVHALKGVSLTLRPGEVLGLVGENGSGKSTMLKVIAGRVEPSAGEIIVEGVPRRFRSSAEGLAGGIALAAQEVIVHKKLSVAENLMMGAFPTSGGFLREREMYARATEMLEQLKLPIDPRTKLGELSLQYQQLIGVAKMVARKSKVLLLDEPTSSLAPEDMKRLHDTVRRLSSEGIAIMYITHRMEEYFAIADSFLVLRDGEAISRGKMSETTPDRLVADMVGRELRPEHRQAGRSVSHASPVLEIKGLSVAPKLKDISLKVHRGEVVGIAGLAGAGRSTLLRAAFGAQAGGWTGKIEVDGQALRGTGISEAIEAGVAYVPEDRKRAGLVMQQSVRENLTLTAMRKVSRGGFFSARAERETVSELARTIRLRCSSVEMPVSSLSGGNQQKVVLGKWLLRNPRILLLDEPTRGVDVGARTEIYEQVRSMVGKGMGVLMASSDLPEMLALCDRILVMSKGQIVGQMDAAEADEEKITALAFQAGSR